MYEQTSKICWVSLRIQKELKRRYDITNEKTVPYAVVIYLVCEGSTAACHAGDQGSIPRLAVHCFSEISQPGINKVLLSQNCDIHHSSLPKLRRNYKNSEHTPLHTLTQGL